MDEHDEIDGGGPDQVPVISDQADMSIGSPREAVPNPESPNPGDDEYRSEHEEEDGEFEDYGEYAIDLSGNNPHRISPAPSEISSRPGRSSVIPPVRTTKEISKWFHI
jgi:hypothetical protein